jgi:hypothetical protein
VDEKKMYDCPCRESARTALLSLAKNLRNKAYALEQLADEMPELSNITDEVLWELVKSYRT